MDGCSSNDGRVEVCVNGRWGNVCNNNQQDTIHVAGAICSQLGIPMTGNMISNYFVHENATSQVCKCHHQYQLSVFQFTAALLVPTAP